jgi:UDP-2,4-diacetamido-2,4,6-trideoxy-beta-L-altropyranose hydrolase
MFTSFVGKIYKDIQLKIECIHSYLMKEHMAKTKLVAFRLDSGVAIGSGHMIRCLTLASSLKEKGYVCRFFCREHPGSNHALIEKTGFEVVLFPAASTTSYVPNSGMLHGEFLGVSQQTDTQDFLVSLRGEEPSIVVIDHYGIDQEWEEVVRKALPAAAICVIDDLADRPHLCDVLVDQNYYVDLSERYRNLLKISSIQLLGPKYALVRPQFAAVKGQEPRAFWSEFRILISFGAMDPQGYGLRVAEVLLSAGLPGDLKVSLMGAYSSAEDLKRLKKIQSSYQNLFEHLGFVSNPWEIMGKSRLFVGAGGSVTWERCLLGLPGIVYSISANQVKMSKDLAQDGFQIYLGDVGSMSNRVLTDVVRDLMINDDKMLKLSTKSAGLVDGLGVNRVADVLANVQRTQ